MKAVILAGGFGTRISEESHLKPKPMVEIGGKPILWHVMKIYSHYDITDFVICCGYKANVIKEYFNNYFLYHSDITFDYTGEHHNLEVHSNTTENWRVTLVDTGLNTMTGGRIKRIEQYIGNEPFYLTYGDGVADIDITKLTEYHKQKGKLLTLTTVDVDQKFGIIDISDDGIVNDFREKDKTDMSKINGGFMVCEPQVFDYILDGDATVFEQKPMQTLALESNMAAFHHTGFWHCCDTQRDKQNLDAMCNSKTAPWMVWHT